MKSIQLLNRLLQRLFDLKPYYPWFEILNNSNIEDFYLLINKAIPEIHVLFNNEDLCLEFLEEDPDIEPSYSITPRADLGNITFHIYI